MLYMRKLKTCICSGEVLERLVQRLLTDGPRSSNLEKKFILFLSILFRRAGRIKAYKNFKKTKIGDQVFMINCDIEGGLELKFDVNKQTLNCFGLFMALADFARKYPYISSSSSTNFGDDAYPDIDFAGVAKKYPTYGSTLFRCTADEAKKIKQGLGNTWNYSKLKLWLKFSPETMQFHIVKIFILPGKKS